MHRALSHGQALHSEVKPLPAVHSVSPVVSIKLQRKQTLGMSKMLQTRDVLPSLVRSLAQTPANTAQPRELTEHQAGCPRPLPLHTCAVAWNLLF